jgi:hypothetical protein
VGPADRAPQVGASGGGSQASQVLSYARRLARQDTGVGPHAAEQSDLVICGGQLEGELDAFPIEIEQVTLADDLGRALGVIYQNGERGGTMVGWAAAAGQWAHRGYCEKKDDDHANGEQHQMS